MIFLVLLRMIFSATLSDCMNCGWPYDVGVNASGKCYPTYKGFQSGLSTSCLAYCNSYQNAADTQQTTGSVYAYTAPTGGAGPYCSCIRLNPGGFISYKTRPQGSCDWGYSDDMQSYYDSLALSHRSEAVESTLVSTNQISNSGFSYSGIKALIPIERSQGFELSGCIEGYQMELSAGSYLSFYNRTISNSNPENWRDGYHNYALPADVSCLD